MTTQRPGRSRRTDPAVPRAGAALSVASWHPAVAAWARRRPPREVWAVALSGGADSVALLHALRAHFPRRRLVALHFNHRLRGRAAAADARFCAALCRRLGVTCVIGAWRRKPGWGKLRLGPSAAPSEAASRAARHEFFAAEMRRRRLRVLWLGHQLDDVAETMFMRLARGSGTAGLAAPRPVQPQSGSRVFLRPLLPLPKSRLAAVLRRARVPWREDASNAADDHLRNRIRRTVLPAWLRATRDRDALAGAGLSRELLEEDDAALEAWVEAIGALEPRGGLNLRKLAGKPRGVVRRALHRWLQIVRPPTDLSRLGFAQLLGRVEAGRPFRFSLGANGFAVARAGRMHFVRG